MNQLLLLIYYHKSLESTWNDKEKQHKPIIFIRMSKSIYLINRNIGVLSGRLLLLEGVNKTFIVWVELSSVILRDHFVSGARVDLVISCYLIGLQSYTSKLYLYQNFNAILFLA